MIKTITFAILHFSVAFSVAYILTGSIGVSSAVALVEPCRLLFSRKSVEPLREKQIRKTKIVGASASVRLKFQTALCLIKNDYAFAVRPSPSKCQTLK